MIAIPEITNSDIDELQAEHNATFGPTNGWSFDEPRRLVLSTWDDTQACPGSGKTTLVAAKALLLVKKWREPFRGICALTHTNVARNEILDKLRSHPAGFALNAYPHFIGTIQEFVDTFLGLPYARTQYEFTRFVDDNEGKLEVRRVELPNYTIAQICNNLRGTCSWAADGLITDYLGSLEFLNAQGDLRFFKQNGSPEISLATSGSVRRGMLSELKESLSASGIFQYRDMYAFAEKLIEENPQIVDALRMRFPVVLIDEMQDTQKFQDTLLGRIFNSDNVKVQRLGDPDQAIFDGIGGEEPNDTYNGNLDLREIKTSHRFGTDIAEKIIGLSYTSLDAIESDCDPERGPCRHTIFLYDDDTRNRVLEEFGNLVSESDPEGKWRKIKAVGGIDGANGEIRKYWSLFDKNRGQIAPRPQKLVHIVRLCAERRTGHVSPDYELLLRGVADLLRKANKKLEDAEGRRAYFTPSSLMRWLRKEARHGEFRRLLTDWISNPVHDSESWEQKVETLKSILELGQLNAGAVAYLDFDAQAIAEAVTQISQTNIYRCENGREISVGTIHSVKGETHDATLILETTFRTWPDCKEMFAFMIDKTKARPNYIPSSATKNSTLAQYMRKLYVAGSRPRHLLCIATHKDHLSYEERTGLENDGQGWKFVDLTQQPIQNHE